MTVTEVILTVVDMLTMAAVSSYHDTAGGCVPQAPHIQATKKGPI